MASEEEPGGGDVVRVGVVCVDFWCNKFGMQVCDRDEACGLVLGLSRGSPDP
uniref:Uncharacterized protein n=1 Tax=Oryza sativa subsp. japonica TaxID=39947 RepID=Q6YT75_ORYSJ|nr:hypothetical protein [Oryza sativa Japonica Group]